jgi:hypothetical protein
MVGLWKVPPYYNIHQQYLLYILNGNSSTIIYILAEVAEFLEKPNSIP